MCVGQNQKQHLNGKEGIVVLPFVASDEFQIVTRLASLSCSAETACELVVTVRHEWFVGVRGHNAARVERASEENRVKMAFLWPCMELDSIVMVPDLRRKSNQTQGKLRAREGRGFD